MGPLQRRSLVTTAAALTLLVAAVVLRLQYCGPLLTPAASPPPAASPGPQPLGRRGIADPPAPTRQLRRLTEADLPPGCLLLRDACLDQGVVVVQGKEYRPDAPQKLRKPVPSYSSGAFDFFPWELPLPGQHGSIDAVGGEILGHWNRELQLRIRPRSAQEPCADLRTPAYNDSAIVLIYQPMWPYNYGHTLCNNAGWLYTNFHLNSSRAAWASALKIAVRTHDGLGVPSYTYDIYSALTALPVETLADFSARPAGACGRGADPAAAQALVGRRCFRQAMACSGPGEYGVNSWQTGQYIAGQHRPLPPSPVTFLPSRTQQQGEEALRVLKVLFVTRPGPPMRQFTNLDELLEECRRWEWVDERGGAAFKFQAGCASWDFKDIRSSIAVAQSTDVMVATHGAHMVNGFVMRPGSSVVEVFPEKGWLVHKDLSEDDPASELQWWGLDVWDPALLTPGALELEKERTPALYSNDLGPVHILRDKNIRLPWTALQQVLQQVARVNGSTPAYRALRDAKQVHYELRKRGKFQLRKE